MIDLKRLWPGIVWSVLFLLYFGIVPVKITRYGLLHGCLGFTPGTPFVEAYEVFYLLFLFAHLIIAVLVIGIIGMIRSSK